ncbi:hypothetical protein MTR66_10610 [Novosphingobium sp. 2638]|uniref:Uncharacterized protein n=1 Tax=Novosphingobium beihaiensis TaxID=2930389 RepID=A0ABT0BQM3_9SPHN|nr:hypothetical protein [Novosphingobium beihaiensis]
MHEHIIAAFFALDETKALGTVEELDDALALANDLGGHAAATRAAAAEAAASTAAATGATATETATIIAAEAAATAEAVSTASKAITAAAAKAILATETILSSEERIEIVLPKPIPLIASPSATTSIKTHLYERTLRCALKAFTRTRGRDRARHRARDQTAVCLSPAITSLTRVPDQ